MSKNIVIMLHKATKITKYFIQPCMYKILNDYPQSDL